MEDESGKVAVAFTVQAEIDEDENILLVGSTNELGKWCLYKGIALDRVSTNTSSRVGLWRAKVEIAVHTQFQYRYVVVGNYNPLNARELVVKKWEAFRKTRIGLADCQSKDLGVRDFATEVCLQTDTFGLNADEENMVGQGFLTCQTEVQLRVHNSVEFPLVLFCQDTPNQFNVTVRHYNSEKDKRKSSLVTAKKLQDFHYQEFFDHKESGCTFVDGEYIVLSTQISDLKKLMLEIVIKSVVVDGCPTELIGQSVIVASQLQDSTGTLIVPLIKDMIPVGQLLVDYLVVKPFEHSSILDMEPSPAAYWNPKPHSPFYIGHRGLGSSFNRERPAYLTENTIGGFVRAHEVGADYVEFDVLLTKDGVPVVYHDFDTDVLLEKKNNQSEAVRIEVKDLTLEQLHSLKSPKLPLTEQSNSVEGDDEVLKKKLFPTLQEVFQHTPPSLHFDVELKYPVYYMDNLESREAGAIDINKYVDTVLKTVFDNAKDRNLFFSCFDPDVCTLLRLKQHRYPVMFLSCCINDVYTKYKDIRSRSIAFGTSFVLSEGINGLGLFSTPLLKDPWKVEKARNAGIQAMFVWGDENNEAKARERLKEMGVDGILCDRIYELNLKAPEK